MSGQFARPRAAPNGPPLEQSQKDSGQRPGLGISNGTPKESMAAKFESEKRRIIESCFGKRDADGSVAESYITHIRILEDAQYPSTPPPPTSLEENKKPRIVIIAVRKSGRVRMHKARENTNGSFSIGKTWVLDDLAVIESFAGATSTTPEQEQRKEWAGNMGFIVTIQKAYYWQANTAKEKDFFIGSLIKIYKKYTGGKLPQLFGFAPDELDQLTGGLVTRPPKTPPTQASRADFASTPRPTSSGSPSQGQRSLSREARPSQLASSRPRTASSQERELAMPGRFPSSESVADPRPGPTSRFQPYRSQSPSSSAPRNESPPLVSPLEERSLHSLDTVHSTDSFQSRRELQGARVFQNGSPSVERLKPSNRTDSPSRQASRSPASSIPSSLRPGTPSSTRQISEPPERKRPPIQIPAMTPNNVNTNQNSPQDFVTPSVTPIVSNNGPSSLSSNLGGEIGSQQPIENDQTQQSSLEDMPSSSQPIPDKQDSNRDEAQRPAPLKPFALRDKMEPSSALKTPFTATIAPLPESPAPESPATEDYRPGLGPMIKKKSMKDLANQVRRAAMTANAFKPRAGGAAARVFEESSKAPNTPDGINGVFPAPSLLRRDSNQDSPRSPVAVEISTIRPPSPQKSNVPPEIKIAEAPRLVSAQSEVASTPTPEPPTPMPEQSSNLSEAKEEARRKRPSDHSAKYAKALGIDPALLEGRTADFELVLGNFGWGEHGSEKDDWEKIQSDIRRDLARVETGSWLGALEHSDDRVAIVGKMLDKAIAECDELDGLLTLYNVELGTLSEDVAYIEAQSQGLQVQTANQRLLHTELQGLLETITISASQLRAIKDASLTNINGVNSVETALVQLYKAMLTIDPKLRQHESHSHTNNVDQNITSTSGKIGSEISTMRAVREKQDGYQREITYFIRRFKQHMSAKFQEAEAEVSSAIKRGRDTSLSKAAPKLDSQIRDKARSAFAIYTPLMLFTREMGPSDWEELMRMYQLCSKKPYQEEFRELIATYKRIARKPTGDEQELLFTTQEKEVEGIVGRKLTVRRTKTVRVNGTIRNSSGEKPKDGNVAGYEAFSSALYDMTEQMSVEQNFMVNFFHLSSLSTLDFQDAVAAAPPMARQVGNLLEKKLFDPDRQMARRVQNTMDEIYTFWLNDLDNMIDWVLKQDAMQGVGVMFSIETKLAELEDSNQDYLTQTLQKSHSKLISRFDRFVEEQIRAIEDTKVKIKKRKGVIAFIKTFPPFSSTIEMMLPPPRANTTEVRQTINEVYNRINKTMFESLKFIAKESPTIVTGQQSKSLGVSAGDAEDKEILNYHILLIENMNHYIEEVDVGENSVLNEWRDRAVREMTEHMDLYLSAVIRRPLGKLLDFLESTESLLAHLPQESRPTTIASRASHSRSIFKKLLGNYDGKEIRRGIETLKKRVEKHFGDADDPGLSRGLVTKVLRECEERYGIVKTRVEDIIQEVYEGGPGLEVEWRKEDVAAAFRR